MTRLRRYVHNVASGQLLIGANVLFTLLSVPLALRYLTQSQFALWNTLVQISGYLMLIDLGLSGSMTRLLVDEKEDSKSSSYLTMVRTGFLVQIVQGILITLVGWLLAPALASLMEIPAGLQGEFVQLVRWQAGLVGASFATRIFTLVLRAHQRVDVANLAQIAGFGANLTGLWLGLLAGGGVNSVIVGSATAWLVTAAITMTMGFRMELIRPQDFVGRFSVDQFRSIFGFGFNIFLVTVGTQAILFSQMIVIARSISFEAYGVWAVTSKAFTLLCQVIWRVYDMSESALAEMMVRNEKETLRRRYQGLFVFVVVASSLGAIGLAMCNAPFVAVWTHGRLAWMPVNNLLLGIWLVLLTALHCHNCLIIQTKVLGRMPYVYFLEGICVLGLGLYAAERAGFSGMIIVSILCSTFFSGAYGTVRVARYFGIGVRDVLGWMLPAGKALLVGAAIAGPVWALARSEAAWLSFGVGGAVCGLLAIFLIPRFALSGATREEMLLRLPQPVARVAGWLVPKSSSRDG